MEVLVHFATPIPNYALLHENIYIGASTMYNLDPLAFFYAWHW